MLTKKMFWMVMATTVVLGLAGSVWAVGGGHYDLTYSLINLSDSPFYYGDYGYDVGGYSYIDGGEDWIAVSSGAYAYHDVYSYLDEADAWLEASAKVKLQYDWDDEDDPTNVPPSSAPLTYYLSSGGYLWNDATTYNNSYVYVSTTSSSTTSIATPDSEYCTLQINADENGTTYYPFNSGEYWWDWDEGLAGCEVGYGNPGEHTNFCYGGLDDCESTGTTIEVGGYSFSIEFEAFSWAISSADINSLGYAAESWTYSDVYYSWSIYFDWD